jgi:hypothetical protein
VIDYSNRGCVECGDFLDGDRVTIPDEETGRWICGNCWISHRNPGPGPGYEEWEALVFNFQAKTLWQGGVFGAGREETPSPHVLIPPLTWVQTDLQQHAVHRDEVTSEADRRIGVHGEKDAQAPEETDPARALPASREEPTQADLEMLDDAFAGDVMADDQGDLGDHL